MLGAALVLAGGSWYLALATPPYHFIDEQAHVGYVLAVRQGHLPTIDTPTDGGAGGSALEARLATEPPARRDVWVANNPPFSYLLAVIPGSATQQLGVPGGPLLGLRLLNVLAAAGAVALTYLLGRDLSGGDRTVGLTAAGLVALAPHVGFIAGLGFTDGIALLTTTGITWSLVRVMTATPPSTPTSVRRRLLHLGCWCAAGAAVRPMALAFAAAAAAIAWVATWKRVGGFAALVRVGAPAAILTGWWYVLNVVRYGDPTGSSALFDKFQRTPHGSMVRSLVDLRLWQELFRTVATRRTEVPLAHDPLLWFRLAEVIAVVGVVGTVVLLARSRSSAPEHDGATGPRSRPPLPRSAWAAVAVLALVPFVLVAQHASGGGAPHPRYLLATVPVLASAIALATVAFATRWAAVGLLAALAVLNASQTRMAVRAIDTTPRGVPGSDLVAPVGDPWVRGVGAAMALGGLVLLCGAVVALDRRRPSRVETPPDGAIRERPA